MCHELSNVAPLLVVVMPAGNRTCCPINLPAVQSFIASLLLCAFGISAETRALHHLLAVTPKAAIQQIVHIEFRVLLHSAVQFVWNYSCSAVQRIQHLSIQTLFFLPCAQALAGSPPLGSGRGAGSGIMLNVPFFKCSDMYLPWQGG